MANVAVRTKCKSAVNLPESSDSAPACVTKHVQIASIGRYPAPYGIASAVPQTSFPAIVTLCTYEVLSTPSSRMKTNDMLSCRLTASTSKNA